MLSFGTEGTSNQRVIMEKIMGKTIFPHQGLPEIHFDFSA